MRPFTYMSEFRSDSTLLNRRVINLHLQRLSRAELCTPTLNGLAVLLKVLLLRLGNIPTKDQWDDEKLNFSAIVDHDDSDHDQFLVKYTRRRARAPRVPRFRADAPAVRSGLCRVDCSDHG